MQFLGQEYTREEYRRGLAGLLVRLYKPAGYPYGKTVKGLEQWIRDGCPDMGELKQCKASLGKSLGKPSENTPYKPVKT